MKPAEDPAVDYKNLVRRGYDNCAKAYSEARKSESEPTLQMLIERLPPEASVLDIGCGAGVPVSRELAGRAYVTGIDISDAMIQKARANVPAGTFLHGDIMATDFAPASFDAVVAFYSVFHLPREDHVELFRRVYTWLKPGGYFLATLTHRSESGYTEDGFFGVTMYWSNHSLDEYKEMLSLLGFTLLENTVIGHGFDANLDMPAERHPLLFAQKRHS